MSMTNQIQIATESGHFYWPDGRPCYTWKHPDKWAVVKAKGSKALKLFDIKEEAARYVYNKYQKDIDYTLEHRPGKEVATNLSHARKHLLAPSFSVVDAIEAKPGLNFYHEEQLLNAAATEPTSRKEVGADKWKEIVRKEAKRHAEEARQKGVEIHGAIEKWAKNKTNPGGNFDYVNAVDYQLFITHGLRLEDCDPEKSAAHPWGYGCKTDLLNKERRFIADIKCKEFYLGEATNDGQLKAWKSKDSYERWCMLSKAPQDQPIKLHWPRDCRQIAANAHAHGLTKSLSMSMVSSSANYISEGIRHDYTGVNIYVSTSNPGQVYIHQWTEEELKHELHKFYVLLQYWKLDNKYNSSEAFKKVA